MTSQSEGSGRLSQKQLAVMSSLTMSSLWLTMTYYVITSDVITANYLHFPPGITHTLLTMSVQWGGRQGKGPMGMPHIGLHHSLNFSKCTICIRIGQGTEKQSLGTYYKEQQRNCHPNPNPAWELQGEQWRQWCSKQGLPCSPLGGGWGECAVAAIQVLRAGSLNSDGVTQD